MTTPLPLFLDIVQRTKVRLESDMQYIPGVQNGFLNVYARKTFNLDPAEVGDSPLMTLAVNFDDGFEAYINGVFVAAWPRNGGPLGQHEAGSSDSGGGVTVPPGEVLPIDWGRKRPPEQYPLDAVTVQSALAGRTEHVLAIEGKNVEIDSSDFSLAASLRILPSICEGDFEPDGDVDGSDLAVFAADFGRTDCDTGSICEGDFDNDNDVDGSDLAVFAADFGRTDCPNSE